MNKYEYMRLNSYYYVKYGDMEINRTLYELLKYLILSLFYGLFVFIVYMIMDIYMNPNNDFFLILFSIILNVSSFFYLNYLRSYDFSKLILNTILFLTMNNFRREITIYKVSNEDKFYTNKLKIKGLFLYISIYILMLVCIYFSFYIPNLRLIYYLLLYLSVTIILDRKYYMFILNLL